MWLPRSSKPFAAAATRSTCRNRSGQSARCSRYCRASCGSASITAWAWTRPSSKSTTISGAPTPNASRASAERRDLDGRRVVEHAVASLVLRRIQRAVGTLHQVGRLELGVRGAGGKPNRNRHARLVGGELVVHRMTDALPELMRRVSPGAGQNDRELLATYSCWRVTLADGRAQHLREAP